MDARTFKTTLISTQHLRAQGNSIYNPATLKRNGDVQIMKEQGFIVSNVTFSLLDALKRER